MVRLTLAYLSHRPLSAALNALLVAIAAAMLTILLQVSTQAAHRFSRDVEGVDLVVGAKGSPLQLILSSVFLIEQPTGNIPFESLALLKGDPAIAQVTPMALGDNFQGYRIVGTDKTYLSLYGAKLAEGRLNQDSGEVVIGARMARETGARIGQQFFGSHGLEADGAAHDHAPFTIVGILAPTGRVIDRAVITSVETVWDVHGIAHEPNHGAGELSKAHAHDDDHDNKHEHDHGDEPAAVPAKPDNSGPLQKREAMHPDLTALLVVYRNASAAVRVPSALNRQIAFQAASPAVETARLMSLLGASVAGAQILGWVLALVAGLAIFVALLQAAQTRSGDLALLRVMGADRPYVFLVVLLEGVILAVIGLVIGIALAHGLLYAAVSQFDALRDFGFDPFHLHPGTFLIAAGAIAIAAIAASLPAWRVYSADILPALSRT